MQGHFMCDVGCVVDKVTWGQVFLRALLYWFLAVASVVYT